MSTLLADAPATEHTLAGHPENAGRMAAVLQLLQQRGILADLKPVDMTRATTEQLARVHSRQMIERVQRACNFDLGRMDADTYVTPASYELARVAAGAVCTAVDQIVTGLADNGFALVRPPGHHAEINRVGGFCLFNNVAVAARQAQVVHGLERVLIVDFDVHHGNGTQDIFYNDPSVLFVSLHLYHPFFYPGTGSAEELGYQAGQGQTLNVPFHPGVGDDGYNQAFEEIICRKAVDFKPEIILVSAGFDAHWIDPLASAGLSLNGYAQLARTLVSLAGQLCQGRILFVLEGGYHLDALAFGVLNSLYALLGRDLIVDPLGAAPDPEQPVGDLLGRLKRLHLLS